MRALLLALLLPGACLVPTIGVAADSPPKQAAAPVVFSDAQAARMAGRVKAEFLHAWLGYRKYAWGHDALKPLSKAPQDWYGESLLMTPVDARRSIWSANVSTSSLARGPIPAAISARASTRATSIYGNAGSCSATATA